MKKTVISYSALLDLMTEAVSNQKSLPNETGNENAIQPNPAIDTTMNTLELEPSEVVPTSKEDVIWLLRQAVEQVPDDSIENLYQQVISSIEKLKNSSLSPIKPEVDIKSAGSLSGLAAETLSRKERMLESILETIVVEDVEEVENVVGTDTDETENLDNATALSFLKKILALNVGEEMNIGSSKWSRKNYANWQSKSADGIIDSWRKEELIDLFTDGNYSEDDEESDNPVYDLGDIDVPNNDQKSSSGYGPHGNLDGATFSEIGKEFGYSSFGALKAVETAMKKFKFMLDLSDAERLEIILPAMNDYIDKLAKMEEIDMEDIQFLKQHPKDVVESDGFREFLKKYITRAIRKTGTEVEDE